MDHLKRELAALRLDDAPPRSRRGAWVGIALLVLMVTIAAWAAAGDTLRRRRFRLLHNHLPLVGAAVQGARGPRA
jgi:hypothetical protein